MKDYVVFSRKSRPSKFEDVIGQNSMRPGQIVLLKHFAALE
jgi:hypothetical protein